MGIFIYTLFLVFFLIPVTLRAYLSIKNGRSPLPHFQNNVVVSKVQTRKTLGALSPVLFWVFHVLFVLAALVAEAWISAIVVIAYMVASAMLSTQIKLKGIGVVPEVAAPTPPDS